MTFEEDLKKMQEITEKLGRSDTGLEESLKLYEEGMTLVKKLEKQLGEAKRKVEILSGDAASGIDVRPMGENPEEKD